MGNDDLTNTELAERLESVAASLKDVLPILGSHWSHTGRDLRLAAARLRDVSAEREQALAELKLLQAFVTREIPSSESLLEELRALKAATAWQPIETAPKDGAWVLLWWPYWSRRPIAAHWYPANGSNGRWDALDVPCDAPDGETAPTHWMPLPAPPAGPEGREP